MTMILQPLMAWYARTFPSPEDEAALTRLHFMVVVSLGSMPFLIIGLLHEAVIGNPVGVVINGVMAVINALTVLALARGWSPSSMAWPMVAVQALGCNVAVAAVGGTDSGAFAGNVVVLTFAAIVLPRVAVAGMVVAVTLLAWVMFEYPMPQVVEYSQDMQVWSWFVCLGLSSGMVAALTSVTERSVVRAREKSDALEATVDELQRTSVSRDFVQNVVSAIPDFVLVTGPDRRIQMANKAFSVRAGWAPGELVGNELDHVLLGAPNSGEGTLLTAHGDSIPVAISVGELPAPDGSTSLAVWSATDIRAQHATQDALRQAHQRAQAASTAKSSFLANMSHELRTPLNAIIGYGELLEDDIEGPEQQEDLAKIGAAARTLLDLINGVLDLSRIESGKVELQMEHIDIDSVFDPVIDMVRPLAAARGLELRVEVVRAGDRDIFVDAGKLKQVVTNLLTNAVKFTNAGHVELAVERWQRSGLDWLRIVVADTGIGMRPEDLERVFEPFAQVSENSASEFGGTGLGLSICHAFIDMMGGQIHASSKLAEGTRFVVELPAAPASSLRTTPSSTVRLPEAREDVQTVLVVDDDPRFLELVERVLADDERQVICTVDPAAALDWAHDNVADLVLLDVAMPGIDGWTFLVRLRATPCGAAPVAVVSAEADAQVARALGANCFLAKPVSNERLRDLPRELGVERATSDTNPA